MPLLESKKMRMVIAGLVSVGVGYSLFFGLLALQAHYLAASLSSGLGYLSVNFILNRTWAFQSTGDIGRQVLCHAGLHLCNQAQIMAGLVVLVEWGGLHAGLAQVLMQTAASALVLTMTPVIFRG